MRPLLAIILVFFCPLRAAAQAVLYATSGNGNLSTLYSIDPLTANSTLIGNVMLGATQVGITGMAFQPGTGILFGLTGNENSPERVLLTINPLTAQAAAIGTVGTVRLQGASDLSFAANGTLFGWTVRGGPLVTIDPATAARTVIGSASNGTGGNGLAFTPDTTLYLAGPTTAGNLFTVNTVTGGITSVAPLSNVPLNFGNVNAMASNSAGLLFVTGGGSGRQLATINPLTGVMTSVGVMSFEADALVFSVVPVPEPSTWVLLLLGLGGAGLALRRRRN